MVNKLFPKHCLKLSTANDFSLHYLHLHTLVPLPHVLVLCQHFFCAVCRLILPWSRDIILLVNIHELCLPMVLGKCSEGPPKLHVTSPTEVEMFPSYIWWEKGFCNRYNKQLSLTRNRRSEKKATVQLCSCIKNRRESINI